MVTSPILKIIGGILLAGGVCVVTPEMFDQGMEAGHLTNMTSDLKMCQGDLIYESAYSRGRFTQSAAAAAVAGCEVTAGTVLSVQVSPDGREFTLVASSESAPNYVVVSDSAAGGGAEAIAKTS